MTFIRNYILLSELWTALILTLLIALQIPFCSTIRTDRFNEYERPKYNKFKDSHSFIQKYQSLEEKQTEFMKGKSKYIFK